MTTVTASTYPKKGTTTLVRRQYENAQVVPPTILTNVHVRWVFMLFAIDAGAALFVLVLTSLVLTFAKIRSGPNVHLFHCRIFAAQLVNDRILIIYQNVIVSL